MKNKRYDKESFTEIVLNSNNLSDVAKNLGLKPFCGNRNTIKKYIRLYDLDTSHFRIRYEIRKSRKKSLDDIMISGSTYNTTNLKERLYDEGLKERICEKCGQDENWNGEKMSLILDHINGDNTDNRLINLRIVCPNCNATLPTHGGKNKKQYTIQKKEISYCVCGNKKEKKANYCKKCSEIQQRKVKRPPYNQLIKEIEDLGYSGTGRKYDVSDNAIRKWIKYYKKT